MTRQQSLWLFIWIFIFFLFFCVWNKLQEFAPENVQGNSAANTVFIAEGQVKPLHLKVVKDENSVTLSGVVESEETKGALLEAYEKNFKYVRSQNLLVDPLVKPNSIVDFFTNAAEHLSHFQSGYMAFAGDELEIDGITEHNITKAMMDEALLELEGIKIDNKLLLQRKESLVLIEKKAPQADQKRDLQGIQNEIDSLFKQRPLEFLYAKDQLTTESRKMLENLVSVLKKYPEISLKIAGYTDSDGSKKNNLLLSQKRANSVMNAMLSYGIDGSRLSAHGYGESHPLFPNTTKQNKQRNRRVEFTIINGEK